MSSLSIKKVNLPKLSIEEVAKVLNDSLKKFFEHASVSVVDCPNLSEAPFHLASSGLGGKTAIADVGGPPYLIPLVQRNKLYTFEQIATLATKDAPTDQALLVGASAGPFNVVGTNCELMPNVLLKKNQNNEFEVAKNNTHFAKIIPKNDQEGEKYHIDKSKSSNFALMGNFFISEGTPGKVLQIVARKRLTEENFISALRNVLRTHFSNVPVSLGGVFLIESGKAKLHIMPDFSETPILTDEDVNAWLRFYEMNSPLICLSVFHSHDPNLDLRIEHTHCFSEHNQGGHYHYDTTPQDVSYLGYFNLAEAIYRIDAPTVTHQIGRD